MSDGAVTSHTEGDSMDNEERTEVQFNQFELMDTGPSNDSQEFSFASYDGYPEQNLDDISPSISWSVFSTTGHNITDTDVEESIEDCQTTERPFASDHEYEPVSNLIRVFPSTPQPVVSTHMSDEIQANLEEMDYYPESERPFEAHKERYPMSNLIESDSQRVGFEELTDDNLTSVTFGNLCASAGSSTGQDLIEQCEPMGLDAHRRAEDRRFVCPFCEKSFRATYHFDVHFRTHTGEKPYQCDLCDKRFNTPVELTKHRRIHTQDSPFTCDECGHKSNTKQDLARHRITHTDQRPYECPICGKAFNRVTNCKKHIKNVHHKK